MRDEVSRSWRGDRRRNVRGLDLLQVVLGREILEGCVRHRVVGELNGPQVSFEGVGRGIAQRERRRRNRTFKNVIRGNLRNCGVVGVTHATMFKVKPRQPRNLICMVTAAWEDADRRTAGVVQSPR